MNNTIDTRDIEHNGAKYRAELFNDDFGEAPWEQSDGHGKVTRVSGNFSKKPGQVVLYKGDRNECSYLYDFADAMKTAKREGWNTKPYDAPDQALRAVTTDMDYLRGWITGDWCYVAIEVFPLTEDGDELRSKTQYLGMVEMSNDDYIKSTILELIAECEGGSNGS